MTSGLPARRLRPLDRRQVDVWYVLLEDATDPALLRAYGDLLSPNERAQQRRFLRPDVATQYLAAHALVRTTLSLYRPIDPCAWRFERNEYGRPYIDPVLDSSLAFNLSHTDGLVACAVTCDRVLGIDAEAMERRCEPMDIAEHFFAPAETSVLRSLAPAARRTRFFEYWTLKESYVKARHLGLSLPLDGFAFHLEPDRSIRISFDARLADDPACWQFALFRPTAQHVMALSVRRGQDAPLAIALHRTLPLVD